MKKSKSLSKHLFNSLFLLFLMLGVSNFVWAQTNGDYKTRANGDWNSNTTWQVFNRAWTDCGKGDYPGASTPAGAVDISHNVTLPANISVTVRSLDIGSGNGNRLTVNGRLTVNTYMDMSTNGDFTLGVEPAIVVVKGNFIGGNNTELSLSSYFFVYGDLSVRSVGQSDLDINTAHIYVFGDFTSQSTSFTRCDNYDGTTTSTTETCDAGTFESLINNTQNTDPVLESIIQQIIDDKTEDVNNLSSAASCFCTGGTTSLTIGENRSIDLLKWYRGTTQLSNQANPTGPYSYITNQVGIYNALYKIGSIWYQTNSVTITSKQSPTALLSGTTIICSGNSTPITISLGGGGPWNFTYTDGTTPVTVSGQTTSPYILNVSPSSTKTYTLINVNNDCCNGTTSGSATITVNSAPAITSQPMAPVAICSGSGVQTLSVSATGTGLTYSWRRNATPLVNGGAISGQGTATLTLTNPATANAGNYDVVVTGTCSPPVTSGAVAVVVNPLPTVTITNPAAVCSPSTVNLTAAGVTSGSTAGLTYTYWTNAAATTVLSSPTLVATSGTYYIKGTTAAGCFVIQPVTVTVNAPPNITLGTISGICAGSTSFTIPYTATSGNPNQYSISGTGITTVTNGVLGTSPITVNLSSPASGSSLSFTLTVRNTTTGCISGIVNGSVSVIASTAITNQSTAAQTQCLNGSFTSISVTAGGAGTLSYQWYRNLSATNSGGTSLASANGAQTASYTPQASSVGTLYYYCVVTGSCGTATSTVSGAFVVNPTSVAGTSSSNQAICSGSTPSDLTLTGSTGSIQWQSSTDNTTFNNITGATSATLTGAQMGTLSATRYYRAVVTSGVCSSATSNPVTITVNAATTIASQSTSAQTQCLNGTFGAISVTAADTGTLAYQWYSNTTASNSGGTTISGATNASYTPQATNAGTLYYYCVVTGTCGSTPSAVSGAFIVKNLVHTKKITMP